MTKSRTFMDSVLSDVKSVASSAARVDHTESRLALVGEMAEGNIKNRMQRLVDPLVCSIWSGNARHYNLITQASCEDLIQGLVSQGKQEFPAIVRSVSGTPPYEYEVICGARRHWAISWLRQNNYPDYKFLVEVRQMTDEEAFRLSDIENRDRSDVSDYERAVIYEAALRNHYDGKLKSMAKRLEVNVTWLSRFLGLARLPEVVRACFQDPRDMALVVSKSLTPLLNNPRSAELVLAAAQKLQEAMALGELLTPSETLKRLVQSTKPLKASPRTEVIKSTSGKTLVEIKHLSAKRLDLKLHFDKTHSVEVLLPLIIKHFD